MVNNKESVDVLLGIFQALRTEILARSAAQFSAIQYAITALGVLGGIAFAANRPEKRILLLIPLVVGSLGLIWFDNANMISKIGSFVQYCWQGPLQAAANPSLPFPDWEAYLHKGPSFDFFSVVTNLGPPLFLFILIPVASVGLSFRLVKKDGIFWSMITTDVLVICVNIVFIPAYLQHHRETPADNDNCTAITVINENKDH